MINGVLWGLTEVGNPWSVGGYLAGQLENVAQDTIVALRTDGEPCKVLYRHGGVESDYVMAGAAAHQEQPAIFFRVPAREFFDKPGDHLVELVAVSAESPRVLQTVSRSQIHYHGPCTSNFEHSDLTVKYMPHQPALQIEGHYIGWRDAIELTVSLPWGQEILVEASEPDPSWLRDKPLWFSHHIFCRFSKTCPCEIPTELAGEIAILYAWFGGRRSPVAKAEIVLT